MRLSGFKGQVRRLFLNYFRKAYVEKQLQQRKGHCKQCGKCCELAYRCFLLTESRKCLVYHKGRPRQCTTFPLDERDLNDIQGECGYSFG
jgi:bacterioferritin-associated ferredoxin